MRPALAERHITPTSWLDTLPSTVDASATSTLTDTGRTLAIIDLGQGRSAAFFGYRTDRSTAELAEGPATVFPRVYGDMGWAAPEVLAQLPNAESVYFDTISQMVVEGWSRGRVALLGDAAWCVTLFAGFGSSLAVAGADLVGTRADPARDDVAAAPKGCTRRRTRSGCGCATCRCGSPPSARCPACRTAGCS